MSVIVTDKGFSSDDLAGFTALEEASDSTRFLAIPNDVAAVEITNWFNRVDAILIPFPSFADGRGFSLARQLRELGFRGRLRASGHLISDQYYHARRAGFDEVEISDEHAARQPESNWLAQTDWNEVTYQDRMFARA